MKETSTGKRKPMSKKLRFSIFERDNFTCQYCGKNPPEVILHVDHIIPVVAGGTNDPENLRTSCSDCNLGKGKTVIASEPISPLESFRRAQEAMETIENASLFKEAKEANQEFRDEVCSYICNLIGKNECLTASTTGVMRAIREFGSDPVLQWLDQADQVVGKGKYPAESSLMRYFYGILRRQRENSDG